MAKTETQKKTKNAPEEKAQKTSKKRVKGEESEKKRSSRRNDVSNNRVRQIVLASCSPSRLSRPSSDSGPVRISSGAVTHLKESMARFLKVLSQECSDRLGMSGRKTVTHQMIVDILEGNIGRSRLANFGITGKDLIPSPDKARVNRKSSGKSSSRHSSALPRMGVLRLFKKGQAFVITDEAKNTIVDAAVCYLSRLGQGSSKVMESARRQTIQTNDVAATLSINYSC